jgi:serine/threonine-protein kinase RsbW
MTTRRQVQTTTKRRVIRTLEERRASEPVDQTTRRFRLLMRQGVWQPIGEMVFQRSWPSRLDVKQEMMDVVSDLLTGRGWVPNEERSWLVLCLDEAITNAMLHGNEGDPRLPVDLGVACDGKRWQVGISDQGDGFTMASVPDPDDPDSLLLEHGRGIRLMRAWLGSLTYWRRGATVVLSRRCAAIG